MAVTYNTANHWSVLTQTHGSQWKQIFPYCLLNVIIMLILSYIDERWDIKEFEITPQGHGFITLIVSFLLVTRVNMALNRYIEARGHIGRMYAETRELNYNICVYTQQNKNEKDAEWRYEVSYRSLLLLKSVMSLIDYTESKIPIWNMPELNGEEYNHIINCIMSQDIIIPNRNRNNNTTATNNNNNNNNNGTTSNTNNTNNIYKYCHKKRNEYDENLRVPIRIEYLLRTSVRSNIGRITNDLNIQCENRIMSNIDNFMQGYYGIRRFLTTPVPFPLIQMARTFLFLFVYTIPLVFLQDKSNIVYHCIAVFIITYGFIGLETVAIELDDPFGSDPNDFDNEGMAEKAYEDVYLTIYHVDGSSWADKLRLRMHHQYDNTKLITEQSYLLDHII